MSQAAVDCSTPLGFTHQTTNNSELQSAHNNVSGLFLVLYMKHFLEAKWQADYKIV